MGPLTPDAPASVPVAVDCCLSLDGWNRGSARGRGEARLRPRTRAVVGSASAGMSRNSRSRRTSSSLHCHFAGKRRSPLEVDENEDVGVESRLGRGDDEGVLLAVRAAPGWLYERFTMKLPPIFRRSFQAVIVG